MNICVSVSICASWAFSLALFLLFFFVLSYSGLFTLFYHYYVVHIFFYSNERKKETVTFWLGGKDLGGVGGEEMIIRSD